MGSRQVQPPTGLSSSPREDEQTRDSEEAEAAAAAAVAAAAPAASLPTLLPPTLEEPPPPPEAAPGRSCARARVPTSPALPGAAAHAHSPSSRDPSPFDSRPAPKPSSSCFARARAREAEGAEPRPAVGRREARPTSLAPPPGLAADWALQGNQLHALPAPGPPAPGARPGRIRAVLQLHAELQPRPCVTGSEVSNSVRWML